MKVLIFSASYGGGHNANARVVKKIVESRGFECKTVDIVDYYGEIGGFSIQKWFYYLISVKVKFLLKPVFYFASVVPKKVFIFGFCLGLKENIENEVKDYKPDLIISVYGPVNGIIDKCNVDQNIRRLTIVTDTWGKIFYWFYGEKEPIFVMSQKVRDYALGFGIDESRVKIIEPIVDSKYTNILDIDKVNKLKKEFNLVIKTKTILVLAGGEGLPDLKKITYNLVNSFSDYNILVVCGKDKSNFDKLRALRVEKSYANLSVFGFVKNVYELINLSDIVITKAGPMTILEVLMLKKPLIITTYYSQEKGNLDFVLQNNYGIYVPDPEDLSVAINKIFDDKVRFDKYEQNSVKFESLI